MNQVRKCMTTSFLCKISNQHKNCLQSGGHNFHIQNQIDSIQKVSKRYLRGLQHYGAKRVLILYSSFSLSLFLQEDYLSQFFSLNVDLRLEIEFSGRLGVVFPTWCWRDMVLLDTCYHLMSWYTDTTWLCPLFNSLQPCAKVISCLVGLCPQFPLVVELLYLEEALCSYAWW